VTALLEAADAAPTAPGVYLFLGAARELLYIGKAGNLRRRLQQHAKAEPGPREVRRLRTYGDVREVVWEETASEASAAAREADLIVAFAPPGNAAIIGGGRWAYLVVTPQPERGPGSTTFALRPSADAPRGSRVYGCFPHLGKGVAAAPAIACSDGFAGLLRLLWATGEARRGDHYPRRIAGPSPPLELTTVVRPAWSTDLHRLLGGTGARLLVHLRTAVEEDVEPHLRPALRRDLDLAAGFFTAGPAALRALRRRHGLPARPLGRDEIVALLAAELRSAFGDVRLGPVATRGRDRAPSPGFWEHKPTV
jgi:predicted GIY-YIG superfamily endonuclease